jgi:hypothetical protein
MTSPLGWFEVQNLPPAYVQEAAPLIAIWKKHRNRINQGTILPIGEAPDGTSWTGFVSTSANARTVYALLFPRTKRPTRLLRHPAGTGHQSQVDCRGAVRRRLPDGSAARSPRGHNPEGAAVRLRPHDAGPGT